jgi:hypothetical protein
MDSHSRLICFLSMPFRSAYFFSNLTVFWFIRSELCTKVFSQIFCRSKAGRLFFVHCRNGAYKALTIWEYGHLKTTVEIPDKLVRKAKSAALSRGISFKEALVRSLASELDNLIDIGIAQNKAGYPRRKEKKHLHFDSAKVEKEVLRRAEFLRQWDSDPAQILFEDRKARNDFLLF